LWEGLQASGYRQKGYSEEVWIMTEVVGGAAGCRLQASGKGDTARKFGVMTEVVGGAAGFRLQAKGIQRGSLDNDRTCGGCTLHAAGIVE
jgi:hypothetical protein